MGNTAAKPEVTAPKVADVNESGPDKKKDKKPCPACSACQETRKVRDACVFEKGEDNCAAFIEAHKQCLRDHGMKI